MKKSLHGLDYIAAEGAKGFDELKEVLENVETCFVDCGINREELDDLTYSCHQAVDCIKAWKAHQLRSCR